MKAMQMTNQWLAIYLISMCITHCVTSTHTHTSTNESQKLRLATNDLFIIIQQKMQA